MKNESLLDKLTKTVALASRPADGRSTRHMKKPRGRGNVEKIHFKKPIVKRPPPTAVRPEFVAKVKALFDDGAWRRREDLDPLLLCDGITTETIAQRIKSMVRRGELIARETGETYGAANWPRKEYRKNPRFGRGLSLGDEPASE